MDLKGTGSHHIPRQQQANQAERLGAICMWALAPHAEPAAGKVGAQEPKLMATTNLSHPRDTKVMNGYDQQVDSSAMDRRSFCNVLHATIISDEMQS